MTCSQEGTASGTKNKDENENPHYSTSAYHIELIFHEVTIDGFF
jgi:hypothetical protein